MIHVLSLGTLTVSLMLGAASPQPAAAVDRLAPAVTTAVENKSKPEPVYPLYQSTIPHAFRGPWDEIISDRCVGRDERFFFGEREFMNFEIDWEVTKVVLYSPVEMDLHTTRFDDKGDQVDTVWEFKLVDNGQTLTGRKAGASFFKRCPRASLAGPP